jgi:ABC-type uncharacterized transport system YnjBCD ATPase subunit
MVRYERTLLLVRVEGYKHSTLPSPNFFESQGGKKRIWLLKSLLASPKFLLY